MKAFICLLMAFTEVEHYMTHVVVFIYKGAEALNLKMERFSSCAKCKQFNIHFPSSYFTSSKSLYESYLYYISC